VGGGVAVIENPAREGRGRNRKNNQRKF